MPTITQCPTLDDLERLTTGSISDEAAEPIERHLLECPDCVRRMAGVKPSDTVLEALGQQSTVKDDPVELSHQFHQLITRLTELAPGTLSSDLDATGGARPVDNAEPIDDLARFAFLAAPQAPDELGRLGGYRILSVIGAGGMGMVFEAEDMRLKRRVALKVMKPELAGTVARERFLREAQAAAALDHDHIVTIYQVGEDAGVPFLAMQLLQGESLDARLSREGKLPLDESLRISREVADGLAAAHDRGLIHRDIKPANLWLETSRGRPRVKILDFGLARVTDGDHNLTQSASILGTPSYMAPEQARAEAIDARADLFSLGCVLYRMTTGQAPFKGTTPLSVLMALAVTSPTPPREIAAEIPVELSDLIMRLLSKEPAGRPASAREVMDALSRVQVTGNREQEVAQTGYPRPGTAVSGADAVVIALPKGEGTASPPRRRGLVAIAAAAGAALLLAGIVITIKNEKGETVAQFESDKPVTFDKVAAGHKVIVEEKAEQNESRKPSGNAERPHPNPLPKGEGTAKTGDLSAKDEDANPKSNPGAPRETPESLQDSAKSNPKAADAAGKSGNELPHSKALSPMALVSEPAAIDGVKSWTIETMSNRGRLYQAEFSPNGSLLATMGDDATLRLWDPVNGKLVRAIIGPGDDHNPFSWSADGSQIAVAGTKEIRIWEVHSGKLAKTISLDPAQYVYTMAWSPDGKLFAVGLSRGDAKLLELFDAESGELLDSRGASWNEPWQWNAGVAPQLLCWSGDSERLVFVMTSGNVGIWRVRDGRAAPITGGAGPACASRGDALLTAVQIDQGDQAALELRRADSGELLKTFRGNNEAIVFKNFSPGGKHLLATAGHDSEETRAYIWDTATGELQRSLDLQPIAEGHIQYALSADGKTFVAFGPQFGNLWAVDVASGKEIWKQRPLLNSPWHFAAAWSPDGGSLALRGEEGGSIWDAARCWPRCTTGSAGYAFNWRNRDNLLRSISFYAADCVLYHPFTMQELQRRILAPKGLFLAVFDPDGGRAALFDRNQVAIVSSDTGTTLQRINTANNHPPAWSADGTRLATTAEKTVIWDVASGRELTTLGTAARVVWSPDGKRLAFAFENGKHFEVRDAEDGKLVSTLENDDPIMVPGELRDWNAPCPFLEWSPDGSSIAGYGRVWDAERGTTTSRLPRFAASELGAAPAWSPDGFYLAYLARDRSIAIAESATGRMAASLLSFRRGRAMSVSPAGHFHASPRFENELVYIVETDAGQETLSPQEFTDRYDWRNDSRQVGIYLPLPSGEGRGEGGLNHTTASDSAGSQRIASSPHPSLIPEREGTSRGNPKSEIQNPKALSPLALVQRPAALPGVVSWSLEAMTPIAPHTIYAQSPLALNPAGDTLAVGGADGHVRLYEPFSGNMPRLVKLLMGHGSPIVAVEWSPDGTRLASAEAGAPFVRVWDPQSARLVSAGQVGLTQIVTFHWSPDGKTLAVASGAGGGRTKLVDPESGETVISADTGLGEGASLAWSPDSNMLAGTVRSQVWLCNAHTAETVRLLDEPEGAWFQSIAWSTDGRLACASGKGVCIWNSANGELKSRFAVPEIAPDNDGLLWMDAGSKLRVTTHHGQEVWDVTGKKLADHQPQGERARSSDGHVTSTGGFDGSPIEVYDSKTHKRREVQTRTPSGGTWSPDGRKLATHGRMNNTILWNTSNPSRQESLPIVLGAGSFARKVMWLGDKGALLTVYDGGTAIWSLGEKGWQSRLLGFACANGGAAIAATPDGKRLAYVANGTDGKTVAVWDLVNTVRLLEIGPHSGVVWSMAWSSDGERLVTGDNSGEITVWDAERGERLQRSRFWPSALGTATGVAWALCWSPDGKSLAATSNDGFAVICDDKLKGAHELPRPAYRGALALGWSVDGKTLFAADSLEIRQFDIESGKLAAAPRHGLPVTNLSLSPDWSFSPDNAHLATSGSAVRIWGTDTGEFEASVLPLPTGRGAVITAEGHYLAGTRLAENDLIYVVQTTGGQELLSPKEFAARYGWNNDPSKVVLP